MRFWGRKRNKNPWAGIDVTPIAPRPLLPSEITDDPTRDDLLAPRFASGPLGRWLQPRLRPERAHIRVHLDERGTMIWRALDGRRCIGELVESFRAAYPDDEDPGQRVWTFLATLNLNGFVDLGEPPA